MCMTGVQGDKIPFLCQFLSHISSSSFFAFTSITSCTTLLKRKTNPIKNKMQETHEIAWCKKCMTHQPWPMTRWDRPCHTPLKTYRFSYSNPPLRRKILGGGRGGNVDEEIPLFKYLKKKMFDNGESTWEKKRPKPLYFILFPRVPPLSFASSTTNIPLVALGIHNTAEVKQFQRK